MFTRRRFVAGAAGMAAAAALPRTAAAARRRRRMSADVCVVGAGFAGLATARDLVAAGRDVVVLEARDRVGGRVHKARVAPGVVTELGAEYVGPTQDRILALAAAVGVDTFKTYNEGSSVLLVDGQRSLYPASTGVSDDPDFQAALAALPVADQMAAEVPVAAPWKAPRAEEWDKQTFTQFSDQNVATANGRAIFDQAVAGIWGADPREMSLLYALFYIAAAGDPSTPGSLARLITTDGRRARLAVRGRLAARGDRGGAAPGSARRARGACAPHRDDRQGRGDRDGGWRRGGRPQGCCRGAADPGRADRLRAGAAGGQAQAAAVDHSAI